MVRHRRRGFGHRRLRGISDTEMDVSALPLVNGRRATMSLTLNFGSTDFHGLNPEGQVARCREMAIEAIRLASNAGDEKRVQYIDLVTRWSALAAEMERYAGPKISTASMQ